MDFSKISACLIVKNAQTSLKECLHSLTSFDEIIILDNKSTDKSFEIAQNFAKEFPKLRLYSTEFLGFGKMKNLALNYAKNDWILSIDADEILEKEALESLSKIKLKQNTIIALGRKNFYKDTWVKACGWYPDYVYRLFNKNFTRFNENLVHESVIIALDAEKIYIKNALKHYAFKDIGSVIQKMNIYSSYSAEQKFKEGKKSCFSGAIMRLFLVFFKDYFLRKGILYGYKGFIIAFLNASGAFFRYAKLYEKQK